MVVPVVYGNSFLAMTSPAYSPASVRLGRALTRWRKWGPAASEIRRGRIVSAPRVGSCRGRGGGVSSGAALYPPRGPVQLRASAPRLCEGSLVTMGPEKNAENGA